MIDLESANGTKVNGKLTPQEILTDGDVIEIGSVTLKLVAAAPRAEMPPRVLVFKDGPDAGQRVRITVSNLTVGRAAENHVVIVDDYVSTKHCEITFEDGQYFVNDLDSTTGTRVNGKKVTVRPLNPGDVLGVGKTNMEFADPYASSEKKSAGYAFFFTTGPLAGREAPVTPYPFTIGRHSSNELALEAQSVSTTHAAVVEEGDRLQLVDYNSRNGTFLNRAKILKSRIKHGDYVKFGDVQAYFKEAGKILDAEAEYERGAKTGGVRERPRRASVPAITAAVFALIVLVGVAAVGYFAIPLIFPQETPVVADPDNLLGANASFEEADADGRAREYKVVAVNRAFAVARIVESDAARSGKREFLVEYAKPGPHDSVVETRFARDVKVDPAKSYRASIWAALRGFEGIAFLRVDWLTDESNFITSSATPYASEPSWTELSFMRKPPEGAQRARIQFLCVGTGRAGGGSAAFDDLSFKEIEVPGVEVEKPVLLSNAAGVSCRISRTGAAQVRYRGETVIEDLQLYVVPRRLNSPVIQDYVRPAAGYPHADAVAFALRGEIFNPEGAGWLPFEAGVTAFAKSTTFNYRLMPLEDMDVGEAGVTFVSRNDGFLRKVRYKTAGTGEVMEYSISSGTAEGVAALIFGEEGKELSLEFSAEAPLSVRTVYDGKKVEFFIYTEFSAGVSVKDVSFDTVFSPGATGVESFFAERLAAAKKSIDDGDYRSALSALGRLGAEFAKYADLARQVGAETSRCMDAAGKEVSGAAGLLDGADTREAVGAAVTAANELLGRISGTKLAAGLQSKIDEAEERLSGEISARAEDEAVKLLAESRRASSEEKFVEARIWLENLLEKYPDTEAAVEARIALVTLDAGERRARERDDWCNRQLRLAESFISGGLPEKGAEYLNEILERYPDWKDADKVKKLLEATGG